MKVNIGNIVYERTDNLLYNPYDEVNNNRYNYHYRYTDIENDIDVAQSSREYKSYETIAEEFETYINTKED